MTWTDPRTWVTNEVVTSSLLNTHLRDNLKAISHPYDYSSSTVDITSTATETSIYSALITGGDMGANGVLSLSLIGDFLYNNSTSDTLTLRVKYGGSTLLTPYGETLSTTTYAGRFPWQMDVVIANRGAANSQLAYVSFFAGRPSGGINTSFNNITPATAAIDSTADQTLQVTAQWSASSASDSFRKHIGWTYLAQN